MILRALQVSEHSSYCNRLCNLSLPYLSHHGHQLVRTGLQREEASHSRQRGGPAAEQPIQAQWCQTPHEPDPGPEETGELMLSPLCGFED